jgi:hypothetical protein
MKSIKASKGRKLPRLITGPFEAKLQKLSITNTHEIYLNKCCTSKAEHILLLLH